MTDWSSSFILDKLSSLTGERVYKTRGGYLITLNRPISEYTALEPTKRSFRLLDKSVQDLPIGFQRVDSKNWMNQYWTLGGKLHRTDGYPSLINYHGESRTLRLGWYYHDYLHRLNGPASEFYNNLDVKIRDDHKTEETASTLYLRWYNEGGIVGLPSQDITGFTRVRNEAGEVVEVKYDKLQVNWVYHKKAENSLNPSRIVFLNMKEVYSGGILVSREADSVISRFSYKGKTHDVPPGEMIDSSMLKDLNLNGWPLYDDSVAFLMREAFNQLTKQ